MTINNGEQVIDLATAQGMAIEALSCSESPNRSGKDTNVPCNDFISRRAVLEMVNAWTYNLCDPEDDWAAQKEVKDLPSEQPEYPEWAKKVEEYRQSAPSHINKPLAWALYQTWKEYDR